MPRRRKRDPGRIFITGHSSGAHLTGAATVTDWAAYGVPDDVLKGALCCSGMYELHPVSLSSRRNYVDFDAATIEQLSTQRHLDRAFPAVAQAAAVTHRPAL